jgi:hypothetical protein
LAFLRLEVDIRAWRTLDRPTQELLVGRDRLTGCPLVTEDGDVVQLGGCPIDGAPIWASENDPHRGAAGRRRCPAAPEPHPSRQSAPATGQLARVVARLSAGL